MNYSAEAIRQGRANQAASVETPETFATIEGSAQPRVGTELSKSNSRMAGQQGARALELMNNPEEQARVAGWMSSFGMTNQGVEWNQAKMNMSQPEQPAPEQEIE